VNARTGNEPQQCTQPSGGRVHSLDIVQRAEPICRCIDAGARPAVQTEGKRIQRLEQVRVDNPDLLNDASVREYPYMERRTLGVHPRGRAMGNRTPTEQGSLDSVKSGLAAETGE